MNNDEVSVEITVDDLVYRLGTGRHTIGRGSDNDIILPNESVSTSHAALTISRESALLVDLNSSNGCFINGQRKSEACLRSGDIIGIGGVQLAYRLLEEVVQASTPPPLPTGDPLLDTHLADVAERGQAGGEMATVVKEAVQSFKRLDYGSLFPFRKMFQRHFLKQRAVRWVLTFGLFPSVIALFVLIFGLRFDQSAWLIGGYFCYFWAVYFNGLVNPDRPLWKRGIAYLLFTAFLGIPLLLAWQKIPIIGMLYSGTESDSFIARSFGFVAGVGIFEEVCKALPLLFFSLRRGPIPIREGMFLALMSGLGFALAEVVQYSIGYWQQTAQLSALVVAQAAGESRGWFGAIDVERFSSKVGDLIPALGEHYGTMLTVQIVRFIPLPLLHAMWAGILGWFIAAASRKEGGMAPTILVGLLFVAVLHGFYDVFTNSILGLVIAAFSVGCFFCYLTQSSSGEHTPQHPQKTTQGNLSSGS